MLRSIERRRRHFASASFGSRAIECSFEQHDGAFSCLSGECITCEASSRQHRRGSKCLVILSADEVLL